MNIKLWLSLVLSGCLGSCVVIDERYVNYHISTDSKQLQHIVSKTTLPPNNSDRIAISVPPPESNVIQRGISCAPFISPPRERLPSVPDFEQSDLELEIQIANYINSIYAAIHKERQTLDLAIALHLESCTE